MQDLSFISLSERMYKYTRSFSIKSVEDALVELITNSIDAYKKHNRTDRKIFIDMYDGNTLKVRDYACGLFAEEMSKCFLQVGNYTNVEGSRGFFSRGAKDISAIGDITFNSIKNNAYSQIFLNKNAYGNIIISDIPVTDTIRKNIEIPDPYNGLVVTINIMPNFQNNDPENLARSLSKLCTLRDIMADPDNEIIFSYYDKINLVYKNRLSYEYPLDTMLLNLEYKVPGYEDTIAKFVVYKTEEPIMQPVKESELEFGFLIKDSTTIYECNTIDSRFRWNPYMPYLRGYLYCENISKMLMDYDNNGSSVKNPFPIIDPTRVTGVNNNHPFIQGLFAIPKTRVDLILRELNKSISNKAISLDEVNQLFKDITDYALNVIPQANVQVSHTVNYDKKLAKAIEDDRMNFVIAEQNAQLNSEYNITQAETNNYIEEKIKLYVEQSGIDIHDYGYIVTDETIIAVPSNIINDTTAMVDQLDKLGPNEISILEKKPYIYKLDHDNNLIQLYIFAKGQLDYITNPESEYVLSQAKKFNLHFINDININKRYIIDYCDGICIKININDEGVKKYLISDNTNVMETDVMATINNTGELIFFKELMTSALSDIIIENDINTNKIQLTTGDNYNNMRKIIDCKNSITSQIQTPLDQIFQKYIDSSVQQKQSSVNSLLDSMSAIVRANIDMNSLVGANLKSIRMQLVEVLNKVIT
ncbi:hypothetical protein Hokovirus_3_48 [Hokovirus HKV1]|uniref:Uncharacterized protein n=1 Tax=Hokovirus HKV1 TaxID=1977638 RepID=A0A1V0SGC9_9VIRU|nr:hypothetical protein Hokovirus_3_48 [Hokovirus HKV1]